MTETAMSARSIIEELETRIREVKSELRGLESDWKVSSYGEGVVIATRIERANDELEFLENLVERARF